MANLPSMSDSHKSCDCPGAGWCMHRERARWEPREPNAPLPTYPDAVLEAHAAQAVVGDRALNLAARLRIWWRGQVPLGAMWDTIAKWVGMPRERLLDWCERPEWAQACAQAVEPVLTRIARDAVFAELDPVALMRDAALVAAGQPAELEDGLPSAFLAALPAPVRGEMGRSLALAALDLSTTEGLTDLARIIRGEERRADEEPGYSAAGALAERFKRIATQGRRGAGWRAVERRDAGETLTSADRDALYRLLRRPDAVEVRRAWLAS